MPLVRFTFLNASFAPLVAQNARGRDLDGSQRVSAVRGMADGLYLFNLSDFLLIRA